MKYTDEEIEGIEQLCGFLAKHQDELHTIIYEAIHMISKDEIEEAKDLLIMKTPIIQGSRNQSDLKKVGEKHTDLDKIRIAVDALLKA
jgi:hypothetical protein